MINDKSATIKVVGIGTAGGIILENIMQDQIDGINFISSNTDSKILNMSSAPTRILLGLEIKEGLRPSPVNCESRQESIRKIESAIGGATMVFLIAGLGGETGTNACQLFAEVALSLGIYTVAIVTLPFSHESLYRKTVAKATIINLRNLVNSVLVMPNDQICNPSGRGILDSFKAGDAIVSSALQSAIRNEPGELRLSSL
jgi:cell division protein FtsZ